MQNIQIYVCMYVFDTFKGKSEFKFNKQEFQVM